MSDKNSRAADDESLASQNEALKQKTISGGRAYVVISLVSQTISWLFTFLIIRLLDPSDYGLMAMAMATIAFIQVFSGLGLGAGIVQREKVTHRDTSSIFWFSLAVGLGFTLLIYGLADLNGQLFNNQEIVDLTRVISIVFVITATAIVPLSLMSRQFEFKRIALINMSASLISNVTALVLALNGFGVYTLVFSIITLELCKTLGFLVKSGFKPEWHFSYREVKPFLNFGVLLSLAGLTLKLTHTFDRIIIGRAFGTAQLGFYSTSMNLSDMIIDKVSPMFNQLLFPLMSRQSQQPDVLQKTYLRVLTYYLLLLSPIYVGGIILADLLIEVVLGEKWMPMVFLFQVFCWVNLFKSITSIHKLLLTASGDSRSIFDFNFALMILITAGLYYASSSSFENVGYVWLILFPLITLVWIAHSIRKYQISAVAFIKALWSGVAASFVMGITMAVALAVIESQPQWQVGQLTQLVSVFFVGAFTFLLCVWLKQKALVKDFYDNIIKSGSNS